MMNFRRAGTDTATDIIPPEHRSVAIRRHAFAAAQGILDAEFESVRGTFGKPGLVQTRNVARSAAPRSSGKARPMPSITRGPLVQKYGFAVLVVALSLATFWISGGHALAKRVAAPHAVEAGDKPA